jgi:hypothetical protein
LNFQHSARMMFAFIMVFGAGALGTLSAQTFAPPLPRLNFNYPYNVTRPPSKVYLITAFLKDGTVLEDTSRVWHPHVSSLYNSHADHIMYSARKITPAETDSIIIAADSELVRQPIFRDNIPGRQEEFRRIGPFTGIPDRDVWVWRTKPGKVSLYTEDMEKDLQHYRYLQKSGGPMQRAPLSYDVVKNAVADNAKALRLVRSYRTGKNVYIGMIAAGAGLAFFGLVTNSPTSPIQQELLGGAALVVGASIPYFMTKNNLIKAVEKYNE